MSLSVQPSHTTQEYSMMGSKYERYIWFRATRLNVYLSFLIIPITLEALLRIFSIWLCHCPLLLNVKPKCLCSVTNLIRVPSITLLVLAGRLRSINTRRRREKKKI